jgi:glutamine synthetase
MQNNESNVCDIVACIKKPRAAFTKADIKKFIKAHGIRHVNFMYPGGDGRLKTLNFVLNDEAYLDEILSCGERVDGSSLFSYIEASSSDLYVVPRFASAFVDPFAKLPTL